jgi:hypothetical protein
MPSIRESVYTQVDNYYNALISGNEKRTVTIFLGPEHKKQYDDCNDDGDELTIRGIIIDMAINRFKSLCDDNNTDYKIVCQATFSVDVPMWGLSILYAIFEH